jgi:hypothetical protein
MSMYVKPRTGLLGCQVSFHEYASQCSRLTTFHLAMRDGHWPQHPQEADTETWSRRPRLHRACVWERALVGPVWCQVSFHEHASQCFRRTAFHHYQPNILALKMDGTQASHPYLALKIEMKPGSRPLHWHPCWMVERQRFERPHSWA